MARRRDSESEMEIRVNKLKEVSVPVDKLILDPENIRLYHKEEEIQTKGVNIEDLIWEDSDTKRLYIQILSLKGVFEPLIIDSNYIVKEGNRRLVCLRRLKKAAHNGELNNIAKDTFDNVKCKILPQDTSPSEVALFLAAEHVKSKLPWPVFNRGKHIYDLYHTFGFTYENISKAIRMSKPTVVRMANAYEYTEAYWQRHADPQWWRKYTYFDELLKRKDLKDYAKDDVFVLRFGDWVYSGKFKDVRDVRLLKKILDNEKAYKIFQEKSFSDALSFLMLYDPSISSPFFKKAMEFGNSCLNIPRTEFISIVDNPAKEKMLRQVHAEIEKLLKDVDAVKREVNDKKS